jgi:hypothetical protein
MDRKRIEVKVQVKHLTRCIDIKVVHSRVEPDRVYNRFLPFESILPSHEIQSSFKDDYHENICANNISNLVGSSSLLEPSKSPFCTSNVPFELNKSVQHRKPANSSINETNRTLIYNKHQAKVDHEDPYSHVEFKKITFDKRNEIQNDPDPLNRSIKSISDVEREQIADFSHSTEESEPSDKRQFQPSLRTDSKVEKSDAQSVSSATVTKLDQEIQTESDYRDERSDLNQERFDHLFECDKQIQMVNKVKEKEYTDLDSGNNLFESEIESLEKREEPIKIMPKLSDIEAKKSPAKPNLVVKTQSPLLTKPQKSADEDNKLRVQSYKIPSSPKSSTGENMSKIPTIKSACSQPVDKGKPLQFKCGKYDPKALSKFEMSFQQKFKKSI